MDRKGFNERKSRAQALMLSDYEWLQTQKGRYEWAVSKRLLVEWVNDVGCHIAPMMVAEGFRQHQGMYDELLQPKKCSRLLSGVFRGVGYGGSASSFVGAEQVPCQRAASGYQA